MKRKNPEEIMNKISSKKKPIYENCSVYTIDGKLLFRCNRKKINWYLSKDLAENIEPKVGEDIAIRLKFVAKGKSHSDTLWGTEDRANQCCVCGALDHLNLHHVFPYVYRKWCPEIIKSHTHHDILPLCTLCHANYEIHAQKLKDAIVKLFDMPLENRGYIEYPDNRPVIKAANALKWHSEKIPEERKAQLFKTINDFFDTRKMANGMTKDDMIEQALILPTLEKSNDFLEHGEYVIKQILSISRKDDHCLCTSQSCPCKSGKIVENKTNENQILSPIEDNKKEKQLLKDTQLTKKESKETKGGKNNKLDPDTTTKDNKDVEKEKEDEDSILLHYSPSETDPEDPNSSTIETDLKIINTYVNRCCGDSCQCQCQRLPMPEKITKEIYKPDGFDLQPIPVNDENQSSSEPSSSPKNLKNSEEVSSTSSHAEEKKRDKDLTPEEKEKQKNNMLERFIKMWRKHFLFSTKPKYLSVSWQVSNSVYSD